MTHWLDVVKRDPVPWLLDPENPSVRFLTMRDILKKPQEMLGVEQQRLLDWAPVQTIFQHWNRFNFWGRVYDPYFGGPVSNFGTLHMLAQLGVPLIPELEPVCENLLEVGRSEDGRFSPQRSFSAPWVCYTGMALKLLWHFGYGNDPRAVSTLATLRQAVLLQPGTLECPMVGGICPSGLVKALDAILSIPPDSRAADDDAAIDALAERLVGRLYDWEGRDSDLLTPTFPRYYDSDLVELCHILSHTNSHTHYRFRDLLQRLLALQTDQGRWCKTLATPALPLERIYHPSRWLTYEAIHTMILLYGDTTYAS